MTTHAGLDVRRFRPQRRGGIEETYGSLDISSLLFTIARTAALRTGSLQIYSPIAIPRLCSCLSRLVFELDVLGLLFEIVTIETGHRVVAVHPVGQTALREDGIDGFEREALGLCSYGGDGKVKSVDASRRKGHWIHTREKHVDNGHERSVDDGKDLNGGQGRGIEISSCGTRMYTTCISRLLTM